MGPEIHWAIWDRVPAVLAYLYRGYGMTEPGRQPAIERLVDLAEAVIGELPFCVIDVAQVSADYRFTLEHVTDGEVWFSLPVQVLYLHDGVVRMLMDSEIERILDILWERRQDADV